LLTVAGLFAKALFRLVNLALVGREI